MIVIEDTVPSPGTKYGPRTPATRALIVLEVGQSFLVQTRAEWLTIRGGVHRLKPKKFSIRTIGRDEWRVWRIS